MTGHTNGHLDLDCAAKKMGVCYFLSEGQMMIIEPGLWRIVISAILSVFLTIGSREKKGLEKISQKQWLRAILSAFSQVTRASIPA